MDSQDNIVLTTTRFDSKKDFFIHIPDKPNKNILFAVKEYDTAELTNRSDTYDIFIENLEEGGEIKLSCGESLIVNDNDHPNPPMEYRIRILNKQTGKSNLFLYKIEHTTSTNESQYKEMVNAIAEYDENLLYEQDAKYLSGRRIVNSARRSLYTLFSLISSNKNHIMNSLRNILENPYLKEKRVVAKTNILKKQSTRSIIKNARSPRKEDVFSSQVIQYADFELNRYLVFMLRFSLLQVDELIKTAINEIDKTNGKLNNILASASQDTSKRKKHTTYQIDTFNRKASMLKAFLDDSRAIYDFINKILASDTFRGVDILSKRDPSIVYHAHYLNIERKLFLPLYQGFAYNFANNYNSILASPIKQTSKLFEAYCLLTINEAVTELGFMVIPDEYNYDHIIKRFIRDDYEIEIMYEIVAKDVSIANKNEVYTISSGARHISPDFYLIVKHDDIPICFLVFDAKCRKPEYVHKSIVEGEYQRTIREYLSLRYSTDDNPFFLPKIVDSLWLLMPNDSSGIEYKPINKLEYRLFRLAIDGNEDNFISELEKYLSYYLD